MSFLYIENNSWLNISKLHIGPIEKLKAFPKRGSAAWYRRLKFCESRILWTKYRIQLLSNITFEFCRVCRQRYT